MNNLNLLEEANLSAQICKGACKVGSSFVHLVAAFALGYKWCLLTIYINYVVYSGIFQLQ